MDTKILFLIFQTLISRCTSRYEIWIWIWKYGNMKQDVVFNISDLDIQVYKDGKLGGFRLSCYPRSPWHIFNHR